MRLARRLIDIAAFLSSPVVFEVAPLPFEDVAVDRLRVSMPRQDARLADAQQVDPVALAHAQTKRPEVDTIGLGDPDAGVFGQGTRDYDVRRCVLRERQLVRHALFVASSGFRINRHYSG